MWRCFLFDFLVDGCLSAAINQHGCIISCGWRSSHTDGPHLQSFCRVIRSICSGRDPIKGSIIFVSSVASATFWALRWGFSRPGDGLCFSSGRFRQPGGGNIEKVEHLSFAAVHQNIGPTCWEAVLLGNSVQDWDWLGDDFRAGRAGPLRTLSCQKRRPYVILRWFLCIASSLGPDAVSDLVLSPLTWAWRAPPMLRFQPVDFQSWSPDHL